MKREIIYSRECAEFIESLNKRAKNKLRYAVEILETEPVLSAKLVKKLVNTDFYELRLSVDNELRIIIFTIGNINSATQIAFLTGFIKKDTKDYSKHIDRAINILSKML